MKEAPKESLFMKEFNKLMEGVKATHPSPRQLSAYVPQHGTEEEMREQRRKVEELLPGIRVLTTEEWEEQNTI